MVEVVERRGAELNVLRLVHMERFRHRPIAHEELRSGDVLPNRLAIDAQRGRGFKARRVAALSIPFGRARIARQVGHEGLRRSAEVIVVPGRPRPLNIQGSLRVRLDGSAALHLGVSGEIPAGAELTHKTVMRIEARQVNHIRRIEDVAVIVGQRAVFCAPCQTLVTLGCRRE